MRPQFTGLCAHAVWVYVFAVYGLMRPYRTGLCARSLRAYAPIPYGSMRPYRMGLCARSLRAYAPMLYGAMCPQFMGLRARISGSYGFTLHGVVFSCCGGRGFTQLRPAALPRRTFQAADIFDAGIEALCQISQVLHDDLVGAERFRAIRHT